MEITQKVLDGVLELMVDGRLDGYWSDYLDRVLGEAIRDGHHQVRVDCAGLVFLSSAGIAILMKFHKELTRINGTFQVINPSAPVSATLKMTRLDALLFVPVTAPRPAVSPAEPRLRFERDGVRFEIHAMPPAAPMAYRLLGGAAGNGPDDGVPLDTMTSAFAIGVGAFGTNADDCRGRFGELLSVAGATAYQPADGTNVPDYLLSTGASAAGIRVLNGLACDGAFSDRVRFDCEAHDGTTPLSQIAASCLAAAPTADTIGLVIIAEVAGLVGATLRQSPLHHPADAFEHPGIRTRLAFTAEPAFTRSVALIAGVVTRTTPGGSHHAGYLRPIGADLHGHLHAAAFKFRPIAKGALELGSAVTALFDADRLQGVMHLLTDDRGVAGAGESLLVRGDCWMGPVAGESRRLAEG